MDLLFVIGRNRSGTKWLSNILAENNEVAAVQREGAGGILESNELSHFPKHFNLNHIEDRTAFQILFKHSNFHKCSGVTDEKLDSLEYEDFYDFFLHYSYEVANQKNKPFFLQKASSNYLPVLIKKYPQAKFIIIQRTNIVENIVSTILLAGKKSIKLSDIIGGLIGYWRYRKLENKYKNHKNVMKVTYEDLKSSTTSVISGACSFMGLKYSEDMLTLRYKPNSSYKSENDKEKYINSGVKFYVHLFSGIFSVLPLFFYQSLLKLRVFSKDTTPMFISRTFELHRQGKA